MDIINYWLPTLDIKIFEKKELFRVRIFIAIILLSQLLTAVYFFFHISQSRIAFASVIGLPIIVFYFSLFLIRKYGQFNRAVIFSLTITTVIISFASIYSDGLSSPVIFWLFLIPVGSSLFLEKHGVKVSITLLIASLASILLFSSFQVESIVNFSKTEKKIQSAIAFFVSSILITGMFQYYFVRLENLIQELKLSNEKSDDLITIICHDMASPLHIINNSLEILTSELKNNNSNIRDYLKHSLQAADTIEQIIKNVRGIQNMEKGPGNFDLSPVNLANSCSHVIDDLDMKIQEKEIRIETEFPSNLKPVTAEKSTLETHILSNLLSNAIKFSFPGQSILMTITDKDQQIELEIKDHGMGIPNDLIPKLFDKKSETSRPGTQGERGNGLGLPIVKGILKMYEASISIRSISIDESKNNHGTSVTIEFQKWPDLV